MRTPFGFLFLLVFIAILDYYVFQGIKHLVHSYESRTRSAVHTIYWVISFISLGGILLLIFTEPTFSGKLFRQYTGAVLFGLVLCKLIMALFFLTDDFRRFFYWSFKAVSAKSNIKAGQSADAISRSAFISWLGFSAGSILFGTYLFGMNNKYNYKVTRQSLFFPRLPDAFDGLRVVHISDIHAGSFADKQAVIRGIKKITDLQPDIVFFTGDLVNNRADEMQDFMDVFSKIKAPYGVFSVLGNHDYGDYVNWPYQGISKDANLDRLKSIHSELGWQLLLNEHHIVRKNNAIIGIVGVENWSSKGRFPKYGDLSKALDGLPACPFTILLSHDPSHWDAQVLDNKDHIDLTLSGHTHGMQFGVEIPGFRWSPVQYMYPRWAGAYEVNNRHLYVNRGFGFLGYPGRVGILPEITLLELRKTRDGSA
ncbi:MAG: metallophosphoesterase [Ferruginibacter sp.]